MSNPLDRHLEWLNQHTEEIIDAERPIIDPHHHYGLVNLNTYWKIFGTILHRDTI